MNNNTKILHNINRQVFNANQINNIVYAHVSDHIQYCAGFFDLEVGDNTISDYFIAMDKK